MAQGVFELFEFVGSAELVLFIFVFVFAFVFISVFAFVFRLPRRVPRFRGVVVAGAAVSSPVGVVASAPGVVVSGVGVLLARRRLDPFLAVLAGVNENFCGDPGTDVSARLSPDRRIRNEMVGGGAAAGCPVVAVVAAATCPICIATPV